MGLGIRFSSTQTQEQAINNWIPWDVWLQILSFLPVRSLLVFRSVCKSFLSIINDLEFASLRIRDNALETRFLTHKLINSNKEVVYEVREIENLSTSWPSAWNKNKIINRVTKPGIPTMITPYRVPINWNVKCSVNGLLLIYKYYSSTSFAALWNPSIKKHRQLSLPSEEPNSLQFGLGHGPSSNDYKIVAFVDHRDQAWVYSVRTDTWTEILDTRSRDKLGKKDVYYCYSMNLFFKNKVLWIEHFYSNNSIRSVDKLLFFEFETGRFRYDKMPYSVKEAIRQGLMRLDGCSSVGVWQLDAEKQMIIICAMETDAMSWTLRYKLHIPYRVQPGISLGYCFTSGSRLEERNGELVWKCWETYGRELNVISFEIDVKTQVYHMKFVGVVEDCHDIYFESLVMLN